MPGNSPSSNSLSIFREIETAIFKRRPNRFVVECTRHGEMVGAYLPNPGRLWELLRPGVLLYITKDSASLDRRMKYTVVAVEKQGVPVFLHTHHTNTVAGWLIERQCIPGLEDWRIERPEFTVGRSRFDFLLKKGDDRMLLEVKSCTLFHDGLAMFPDAVTSRGRRHLIDLARSQLTAGVLFVVHSPCVTHFLPEYHVDPEFSRALYDLRKEIHVKAVSVSWSRDLSVADSAKELKIPWEIYEKEGAEDRGAYLLVLRLDVDKEIRIGKLGTIFFKRGYYIYAGSAMKNLSKRTSRHKRRRKNLFWHIDYLREGAELLQALPVRSSYDLECAIARSIKEISDGHVHDFGASDCSCDSHLFYMAGNPIMSSDFIDTLLDYRMGRLMRETATYSR